MQKERDRNDDYYSKKTKKPDPYYQQQQQQQNPGSKSDKTRYERNYDNRQSRQGSEPRAVTGNNNNSSNNFSNQESIKGSFVNSDRNRDTRSSEPGASGHYDHRSNKPPSGQPRISNSALQRLPPNIDSLPPRLKKKYLLEAGLPEDYADKPIMEIAQQSYSNTLPGRGGRNHRYDQSNYHHQSYQNSYHPKYINKNHGYQQHDPEHNYHHRSLTPPLSKSSRPQLQQQQKPPPPPRYDWKSNDIQRRDETSPSNSKTTKEESNFDWSEDVLNSQSLPHDVNTPVNVHNKYDDNNRHRHRRRRNRR